MIGNLALLGLPEWTALSRVQRRFVWRQCINPMLIRWQVMAANSLLVVFAMLGASWLGAFDRTSTAVIALLVVVNVFMDLADLFVLVRRREQVRRYIQSHGAEIQTAS